MRALYIILALLLSFNFYGQSDNCAGAVPIAVNVGCITTAFNINEDGTGDPAINGSCFAGSNYADEWYLVAGTGFNINVTVDNTDRNCTVTVYTACGAGEIGCVTIPSGGSGSVNFLSLIATNYYIQIQRTSGNNTANLKGDICVVGAAAPPASNTTCTVPDPICSGSPINFTANTGGAAASVVNPGNNYGCLFTSPNPSWFYFQIATPGNIAIDITAGSDIDFALWGPYPSLPAAIGACNAYPNPLDCSYSIAPVEQANALGVLPGQIYVLLVTNYANTVQNITVNTAPGNTATTDCSIVALSATFAEVSAVETSEGGLISWSTYSEQNSGRFDIMHSTNGAIWEKIGSQPAALNSNELKNYSFVDHRISQGANYYKIQEYDLNNAMFESEIAMLYKETNGVTLFPNPSKGSVNISSEQTIISIQVNDLNGTLVYNMDINNKGALLKLDQLKKGTYLVNVLTEYNNFVERIIIE